MSERDSCRNGDKWTSRLRDFAVKRKMEGFRAYSSTKWDILLLVRSDRTGFRELADQGFVLQSNTICPSHLDRPRCRQSQTWICSKVRLGCSTSA